MVDKCKAKPTLSVIRDVENIWIVSVPEGFELAIREQTNRGISFQVREAN